MNDADDTITVPLLTADRALLERMIEPLQREPQNHHLRKVAVQRACDMRQWQLALDLIDAGLQASPVDGELFAYSSFKTLLHAHESCGQAWLGLALLELGWLQYKLARSNIFLALKYMPDDIGALHLLAWIEIMSGNFEEAERAFQRALAVDRNCGETHGGLAVVAACCGNEDRTFPCIERALSLDHDSVLARYAEVVLLENSGRRKEARNALRQILARPARGGAPTYRDLVIRKMMRVRAQNP